MVKHMLPPPERQKLSIIIPAHNEGLTVDAITHALQACLTRLDIISEIIFIDDGSTDDTWDNIHQLARQDKHIAGIKLSKNFGKESAIYAGLHHATGDACIVMDCDLQHPVEVIQEMYRIWAIGHTDIVEGVKNTRGNESLLYAKLSTLFYYLLERLGRIKIKHASDFQLLDRRVVDVLLHMPERQRFFRALSSWVGFRRAQVLFDVAPRRAGVSKFNS